MTTPFDVDDIRSRLAREIGDTLELREVLGAGAHATVFRAHDPRLQRDVAVKVLDPGLGVSADLEERFLREARIVAGIEHPHIVPVYAAESRGGLLFLVMRLLSGRPLSDRIAREGPLAVGEAVRIAHDAAEALAFAHRNGVIHRDIKPDNIMLDGSGNVSVTDFGISLIVGREDPDATRGTSAGTPAYMSPEQALGEDTDGRSDVYALGVVVFEMLTGRVPFAGRNIRELTALHIAAPPPKVSALRPDTPTALAELAERMLAKRPEERPEAEAVAKALAAIGTPEGLRSPSEVRRRRRRKRLTFVAVMAITAVLAVAGVGTLVVKVFADLTRAMDEGDPPTLDAVGAAIPDSIIAAARADGSLGADEIPIYAFIPANRGSDVAIVMTDSVLIRRSPAGSRRIPLGDVDLDLDYHKNLGGPSDVGVLIVNREGLAPDTIYAGLGGLEFQRLRTSLTVLSRQPPRK